MTKSDPEYFGTSGLIERSFTCAVDERAVPVAVWLPMRQSRSPLVLVGHGGSGHKRSEFVLDMAGPLVRDHGVAVAAIDGPVHGDRRRSPAASNVVRDEFRSLWEAEGGIDSMVADWIGALDALCSFREIDARAVAYYGLSMGTAYGLPFLAQESRVRAAVVGMWGTSRAHGARLADDAARVRCTTMFSLQWDDELFTRKGQFELFDRLGTPDKHMSIHPGGHVNPRGLRLHNIVHFLARELRMASAAV